MSGIALEWAIDQNLPSTEKIVLCALASFHSQKNPHPYPSRELLANVAGVTVKTVGRIIPKLEERGLIQVKHSPGRHSNRYELKIKPGHSVPVNKDTASPFPLPNRDIESLEQGHSVHPTGTQCPTNKDMNKDMNKKEGAEAPDPASPAVTEETMWGIGVDLGIDRKAIGRAVKESSKEKVAEVIAGMLIRKPVEPTSYLMAAVSKHNETDSFMAGAI
ncbi:MAG TPA: helix-turn-helix domain-containing protein [Gammaproteobacteria bacterium]|nr:helix-turn-helix domain-containing protein [Gammaproteobacteria bacterium]